MAVAVVGPFAGQSVVAIRRREGRVDDEEAQHVTQELVEALAMLAGFLALVVAPERRGRSSVPNPWFLGESMPV